MNDKPKFDAADLQYYFEAQERDTLDLQGKSRRASEVLKIRDRLLALPEKEFDNALQSIKSILQPGHAEAQKAGSGTRRDATELYDMARPDRPHTKMGAV